MSSYSLMITDFEADNNKACLKEIREKAPDVGEVMKIRDGRIVFEPYDPFYKWRADEDVAKDIISRHIKAGTTCHIEWDLEEYGGFAAGGYLIGRGRILDIRFPRKALSDDGQELSMEDAIDILAGVTSPAAWNFRRNGEHPRFPLSDWKYEVGNGDTVLGYQDWAVVKLGIEAAIAA